MQTQAMGRFLNSLTAVIDNVLLQTNPARTSRFLTSQTFQNCIW